MTNDVFVLGTVPDESETWLHADAAHRPEHPVVAVTEVPVFDRSSHGEAFVRVHVDKIHVDDETRFVVVSVDADDLHGLKLLRTGEPPRGVSRPDGFSDQIPGNFFRRHVVGRLLDVSASGQSQRDQQGR